jgi:hypothetical protein
MEQIMITEVVVAEEMAEEEEAEVEAEAEVDMEDAVEAVVEVAEETTMIQLTFLVYHPESISKTCHSRMRDGINLPRNKSLQYGH